MADEKEVDCGCGSCGCGCSKNNVEGAGNESNCKASSPAGSLGEAIAAGAIVEMGKGERSERKHIYPEITEEDIDGFIEKCDKEGKNPLEVVKFVADSNGIDVMSEIVPDDAFKRRIFNLLKGVVKKVLIGFVSYCADNYGLGFLKSLISACGSCRDSEKSSRSFDSNSEDSVEVCPMPIKIILVRAW